MDVKAVWRDSQIAAFWLPCLAVPGWSRCCEQLGTRNLHGDGDGGNPAESAGNPRGWLQLLREYRGDGTETCRNSAVMEFIAVGNPRGVFGKRATVRFFSLKYLTA